MTLRYKTQFARLVAVVSFVTATAVCLSGQSMQNPGQVQVPAPPAQSRSADEQRFPVALQHGGSWCYGYLHVREDRIRFQVVHPESDSKYSFDAPRSEVTVGPWVILGMPQDAIELKVKGVAYHMRWLANEGEVNSGAARRWAPPVSQPPFALIAAVQNVTTAPTQYSRQPVSQGFSGAGTTAPAAPTNSQVSSTGTTFAARGSSLPASEDAPQDVPPGMLAGVYVATAGAAGPSNTQYLFYPDGFVMNGVPQEGLLNFDFNHYRRGDNPDKFAWVGRYKLEGDEIKIVWQNQFGDPANPDVIQRNETQAHPVFKIGPQVFIPMCRCTGKRLSGTYRWGAPAQDQYIQFFSNGTFLDHRATDQLIVPSRYYTNPRIQQGTYEIRHQTMIFTFADGHRGTMTFLAPKVQENNPTFDWIDFGWHMFFEEGYRAKLSQGW